MESCGGGVREKENGTAGELLLNTMEGAVHWEEQSAARLPVQEGARLGAAETSREGQALLAKESFEGGLSPINGTDGELRRWGKRKGEWRGRRTAAQHHGGNKRDGWRAVAVG
jgi:hypothetical protein